MSSLFLSSISIPILFLNCTTVVFTQPPSCGARMSDLSGEASQDGYCHWLVWPGNFQAVVGSKKRGRDSMVGFFLTMN